MLQLPVYDDYRESSSCILNEVFSVWLLPGFREILGLGMMCDYIFGH